MPFLTPPFLSPHDNLLINGGFDIAQRVSPTASTAMSDDAYDHFDRWYSLRQGANATITRIAGTDGSKYTAKLVCGGTTNRFGIAQIVESYASIPMRGRTIRFQCRIRSNITSGTVHVRCAVLEWTDTANPDAVTSDVVNDWTSSTYTTGNFFVSTTTTLIGTAVLETTHNTWADLAVTGTASSSCTNLIVFIWHEDVPSNSANFFEVSKAGLFDALPARPWIPRPFAQELLLCKRYCCKSFNVDTAPAQASGTFAGAVGIIGRSATSVDASHPLSVPMFTTPTLTTYNPTQANADWRNGGDTADATFSAPLASHGTQALALRAAIGTAAAGYWIHYLATAEL